MPLGSGSAKLVWNSSSTSVWRCLFLSSLRMSLFMLCNACCTAAAVLCGIGFARCAVQLRTWLAREQRLRSIPMPRPHWLLGNLETLRRSDHHLVMRQWADELGGIFRLRLGHIQVPFIALLCPAKATPSVYQWQYVIDTAPLLNSPP